MFKKVLIANRGAIACRIIRTLRKLNVVSVAVYSEADASSLHVSAADEAVCIGPAPATESYLKFEAIFDAARKTGAEAIHPGYGFLSENAAFAEACEAAGFVFIGPSPMHMKEFGLKHTARAVAKKSSVPLLPGSELLASLEEACGEAARIGYPVMLKSTAGGGGIGMKLCSDQPSLEEAYVSVKRLSETAFKSGGMYLEKFVSVARHIEVQVFGDGLGKVVALGERDCSAQRRNQKVVEETPAPGLSPEMRASLLECAVRLTSTLSYRSAGTVEFVFDVTSGAFYFLEVNTRLQVEHGVTEEVTGVDLVEWMVRLAAGETAFVSAYRHVPKGASIQVRLYAEDPNKAFQPSSGGLTEAVFPDNARVETWVERGSEIPSFYDPMIAKIIVVADDRVAATEKMKAALARCRIAGIESNLEYLRQVIASQGFADGIIHTKWLATFPYVAATIDVIEPGTQSSIQDYPGRTGYWSIGVPPSGPMDDLGFRLANRLVGNEESEAGLEITLSGPTLRFNIPTTIALTGAAMAADIDGEPVTFWKSVPVKAGQTLRMGTVKGSGCRTYLAVQGGFQVPAYLGSKSTFNLGKFGGHAGRTLRHGDVLPIAKTSGETFVQRSVPKELVPAYHSKWDIGVLYGPHAAPDFFTEGFISTFFTSDWKVHYNSNRLGIRLVGPKPEFTRADGGEAGLHPSNIHDTEYAIGTINFTGDMPVILAKDGPSLGGFVCPVTIIQAELWKIGQLRPGDTIRFVRTTFAEALAAERCQDAAIAALAPPDNDCPSLMTRSFTPSLGDGAVLHATEASAGRPAVTYRQAGDKYILIEYGPLVLDLDMRFRIHALMQWFAKNPVEGVLELSPGVRSLQVNFDSRKLPLALLVDILMQAEKELPETESMELETRVLRLPLAFDASSTRAAIDKYRQSVRQKAPWLPSNVEFMRRINGLASVDDVSRTIFEASYLVLGLGDVYLGAPCAVPIDPRHRLVTTKYNPARTWTAEGEVGIGGVYMCVYGMESPGGYQLVGRTVPVWNTYKRTAEFQAGSPWLLRFFDQVRFFPMPEKDVLEFRQEFLRGRVKLDIKSEIFSVKKYHAFLEADKADIAEFKGRQQVAFDEERERWKLEVAEVAPAQDEGEAPPSPDEIVLPPGGRLISSPIAGNVWAVPAKEGDSVTAGQKIMIVEAMKMEVGVESPVRGTMGKILAPPGRLVSAGQPLAIVIEEAAP
ncbi:MAG TPA: urea carboxylase [Opitutaceae bacterium]|jgi:urea carboxylase|nr:urea carboxylase [Opitutaceae bacterium]